MSRCENTKQYRKQIQKLLTKYYRQVSVRDSDLQWGYCFHVFLDWCHTVGTSGLTTVSCGGVSGVGVGISRYSATPAASSPKCVLQQEQLGNISLKTA